MNEAKIFELIGRLLVEGQVLKEQLAAAQQKIAELTKPPEPPSGS